MEIFLHFYTVKAEQAADSFPSWEHALSAHRRIIDPY